MEMGARAVALWFALVVAFGTAAAYTVDCNPEFTDCDTELSKIAAEDDEISTPNRVPPSTTTVEPTTSTTQIVEVISENQTEEPEKAKYEPTESTEVKQPRLLNINVDELQNFANALHNQTQADKKKLTDLSDVNLDDDEDEQRVEHSQKIADKFYSHLQAPFHSIMFEKESEEKDICKENEIVYKVGDKIDRGCDETCECSPGGIFDCSPRCKHPYIRRGRRLTDPLCFESPVDECCSIVACATAHGEKPGKIEMCQYGNDTFPAGGVWYVGCEQRCTCGSNSVVTCKPRCTTMVPSEKCINVQDPDDACCEVQVCDVSQDDHELSDNSTTSTTAPTTSQSTKLMEDMYDARSSSRPLALAEPIGSIKVLQNNTVQVNLIHPNNTEDPIHLLLSSDGGKTFENVELIYSNLILNLRGGKDYILKTKETGTKFNFTITTMADGANDVHIEEVNGTKVGCWVDGKFYGIGEEFHIGCSELCECTGADTKECAALVCPNHVGLELMSKGCVRWAPSPPAQPPNCCPRSARCLSDGTCHYNGVPVPNWSEVPITLTGCEQRCFCENGELDCQEVCTPLPPVPPQSMRCPPMHRPAAVNISDEDCCKQWGCVPSGNLDSDQGSYQTYRMPAHGESINYVTPLPPISSDTTQVIPTPPLSDDFYNHFNPIQSFPKLLKTVTQGSSTSTPEHENKYIPGDNITVFTLEDVEAPFKTIHPEPPMVKHDQWVPHNPNPKPKLPHLDYHSPKPHSTVSLVSHSHPEKHLNFPFADTKIYDVFHQLKTTPRPQTNNLEQHQIPHNLPHESIKKIPISSVDNFNLFLPTHEKKYSADMYYSQLSETELKPASKISLFHPHIKNKTDYILKSNPHHNSLPLIPNSFHHPQAKHVTVIKSKDVKSTTPIYDPDNLWSQDSRVHVLSKQPNPYETVLLRAVPSPKNSAPPPSPVPRHKAPEVQKTYSTIDLEHLLSQMEVESEVNKNLGRSADKNREVAAGHVQDYPHKQSTFLPTIPPEINYPEDDVPGYEQNNIHRPPVDDIPGLPPGLQVPPSFGDMNKKLSVISVESDSPTSVTMLLGLPPVLVGLRGSVDLRYTDTADEDVSHWYSQVFAPADEILTTPRLEFRLSGLKPSTTYKIKGKLFLHNLPVAPSSDIYSVRTQDLPVLVPAEEKRREIDSKLTVVDVNDTSAHVSWRHFSEDELQFIDGIQVRYRPVGTPIYSMTELLHHSRSAAELHDLRPGSRYEASLVLIPPPRATTELNDPGKVEFTTAPYIDPYNWTVTIEAGTVGAEAAELTWTGVPSPAERWVRVYRAAHACGDQPAGKEHDEFKLAARDQPLSVSLNGLQPNSKCRVWLELFLTNGKVKTSNVLEVNTKSLDSDNPIDNEISASSISSGQRSRGDYYSALIGVGIVAALGALTSMLLLLVVVRRHRPRSANITPVPSAPRASSLPPYDNPAYKLELQQETMDL